MPEAMLLTSAALSMPFDLSTLSVILFIIGVLLIVIEMFIPGFGAPGITGIILLVVDIFITAKSFIQGLVMASVVAVVLFIFFIAATALMSKGKWPKQLTLKDSADKFSSSEDRTALVGRQGTAETDLRPAGALSLDGEKLDVVSRGEFIDHGSKVEVIDVEGGRIVVKAV